MSQLAITVSQFAISTKVRLPYTSSESSSRAKAGSSASAATVAPSAALRARQLVATSVL